MPSSINLTSYIPSFLVLAILIFNGCSKECEADIKDQKIDELWWSVPSQYLTDSIAVFVNRFNDETRMYSSQ